MRIISLLKTMEWQQRIIKLISAIYLGLAVMMMGTFFLHGPRTCSDATGYIIGAITLRHEGSYQCFCSDEQMLQEKFQCEFRCPKNMADLAEYKRDKSPGYQKHWAPGYPFFVASIAFILHIPVCYAFALTHAVSIILMIYLWRKYIPSSAIMPLSMFLSGILFMQYLWLISMVAFSEVVFLPLSLVLLLLLIKYTENGRILYFVCSLLLCSLAPITRYVGLYLIIVSIIIIYLNKQRHLKKRCIEIVIYAVFSIVPFVVWQVRNILLAGGARGARISQTNLLKRLGEFFMMPGSLFFPIPPQILTNLSNVVLIIRMILAWSAIITFCLYIKRLSVQDRISKALIISATVYLGFIVFTTFWTGEPYPFDYRILLPWAVPLAMAGIRVLREPENHSRCFSWIMCHILLGCSAAWNVLYCFAFLALQIICIIR